jgi:aspartyl aminopeptidase
LFDNCLNLFLSTAVEECKKHLTAQNFTELLEKSPWQIQPGGKVAVNWDGGVY